LDGKDEFINDWVGDKSRNLRNISANFFKKSEEQNAAKAPFHPKNRI